MPFVWCGVPRLPPRHRFEIPNDKKRPVMRRIKKPRPGSDGVTANFPVAIVKAVGS